jgi:hypothetical protein
MKVEKITIVHISGLIVMVVLTTNLPSPMKGGSFGETMKLTFNIPLMEVDDYLETNFKGIPVERANVDWG